MVSSGLGSLLDLLDIDMIRITKTGLSNMHALSRDILDYCFIPTLTLQRSAIGLTLTSKKHYKVITTNTALWTRFAAYCEIQTLDSMIPPMEQMKLFISLLPAWGNLLHIHVAQVIGPIAFSKLPILNLGDNIGWTAYLDFVQAEDMTAPLMKGFDAAQRPFIAMRYEDRVRGSTEAIVVFHRYTNGDTWCNGTCYSPACFNDRFMKASYIEYMDRLLKHEPCGRLTYHRDGEYETARLLPDGRSVVELV